MLGSNPTRALSRQEAMAKARAAALKAVAMDDTLAEAHTSLAFIYWHYDWNWAAAEKEFRRALLLNPSYPTAHHWHAFYLLSQGRLEQALQEIRRARELDPLSLIINTDLGEVLFYNRHYDEAIAQERRTLEMKPDFSLARRLLGLCYLQKHDYAPALSQLQAKPGDPNDALLTDGTLGVGYAMMGQDRAARAVLAQLEHEAEGLHMQELYLAVAEVHSALGDKDGAFRWLQKDYETRNGGLTLIQLVPVFNGLHSDPRFADLVRRIGLPPLPPT